MPGTNPLLAVDLANEVDVRTPLLGSITVTNAPRAEREGKFKSVCFERVVWMLPHIGQRARSDLDHISMYCISHSPMPLVYSSFHSLGAGLADGSVPTIHREAVGQHTTLKPFVGIHLCSGMSS